MDRDAFEREVVALAGEGGRVTAANVSARTGLSLRTCQTLLDLMARDGHLERDGGDDVIVYRVRGLDEKRPSERPTRERPRVDAEDASRGDLLDELRGGARDEIVAAAGKVVVRQAGERIEAAIGLDAKTRRSLAIAALVGFLLGPLGLFYAAPWMTAIVSTVAYGAVRFLPFIDKFLPWQFWLVVHLMFAFASFLYAVRFNRTGRRSRLLPSRPKTERG